jgi:hypothetical protein
MRTSVLEAALSVSLERLGEAWPLLFAVCSFLSTECCNLAPETR